MECCCGELRLLARNHLIGIMVANWVVQRSGSKMFLNKSFLSPCPNCHEEPAGPDLIFHQLDNIMGKISREEVARICVASLSSPYACVKTFEWFTEAMLEYVLKVLCHSASLTWSDPENPSLEKDYDEYLKNLEEGVTGKEASGREPGASLRFIHMQRVVCILILLVQMLASSKCMSSHAL
ncbi:Complex I intermediate-associated protein 30 (CIA30) [Musa troglodytarum]|uniref:Complex I intermediate-associated protein 30 (CIA30) n=1 Tax=Musa troglodytarum TaxID=320322 RepID=A0A9E7GXY3_9LILI|nr:Complex I intermediate-associated protein 30 (CIA30) [Musa troglodytarum]